MATFNQQGQTVHSQYNAETINFGQAKTPDDFLKELKHLHAELNRAMEEKTLEGERAMDAQSHVKQAILQAESTAPDKKTLVEHLTATKALVSHVEGLAAALASAIATVGAFFM